MKPPSARSPLQFSLFFFAAEQPSADRNPYHLLLTCARLADTAGFTAVWTPERHFASFGAPYPSPVVTSTALAMVTSNVSIRAGSVVLPFHDPLRVAEEWSMIDRLSGGRVAVSFASGWHVNDFVLAPAAYADRHGDMLRKITTVQALWRGDAIQRLNGLGETVAVAIRPRPLQSELPIWLTCQSDRTIATAAALGFNVLLNYNYKSPESLQQKLTLYHEAMRRQHGRHGHATLMVHTFVSETDDQARATAAPGLRDYLDQNVDLQQAAHSDLGALHVADRAFLLQRAVDRFSDAAGLIGSTATCRAKAQQLHESGVDEIACLVDFGLPVDQVVGSLQRVADIRRALASTPLQQPRTRPEATSRTGA